MSLLPKPQISQPYNHLGIYFSWTGSFIVCKNHLYEKAIKAMYEVIKMGRKHNCHYCQNPRSHSRTIIWILPIYQKDQVDS
jgi:pyruvate-formate lyase-activating enzyme